MPKFGSIFGKGYYLTITIMKDKRLWSPAMMRFGIMNNLVDLNFFVIFYKFILPKRLIKNTIINHISRMIVYILRVTI